METVVERLAEGVDHRKDAMGLVGVHVWCSLFDGKLEVRKNGNAFSY